MTGLQHIDGAMFKLGKLRVGASSKPSEQTAFLDSLNLMLKNWQAEGLGGVTLAVAGSTRTRTVTAIATYANTGVNNNYPDGWDEAIQWNLAVAISGALGVIGPPLEYAIMRAKETKAAISPGA